MAHARTSRTPVLQHAPPALASAEERQLLEQARNLQRAAAAGRVQPLLRGKNLGLMCADDQQPGAARFRRAAGELGAHVAHIGLSLGAQSDAQEIAHTARVLARLYDAVECQGADAELVQQLGRASSISFFDGLASKDARPLRIARQLGSEAELEDNLRYALQALLLHSIG